MNTAPVTYRRSSADDTPTAPAATFKWDIITSIHHGTWHPWAGPLARRRKIGAILDGMATIMRFPWPWPKQQ